MRLKGNPVSGRPGAWRVCTEERYLRQARPGLLRYRRLAGAGIASQILEVLGSPARGATFEAGAEAIERVNAMGERLDESSEIVDMFTHVKLSAMVAPDAELPSVLTVAFDAIRDVPLADDPASRPFEDAGVHLAQRDPAMTHRIKLPSVLLRFEYDERLTEGEVPSLAPESGDDPGFAAAFDLHSGMLMLEVFFGPLAGCLSPYFWCLLVPRNHGVLIVDLGVTLIGTRSEASELLQILPTYGNEREAPRPRPSKGAYGSAVAWWTDRLDDLFGVLTDPSVFADRDGNYRATTHLHALLTFEQLFTRVVSIQGAARDTQASRALLFSVLDTLQRITARPIEKHCSSVFAAKTIERLEQSMPASAQELLLWGPRRAVAALIEVQQGFFLRGLTGDQIRIRDDRGSERWLNLDTAAAHYLKVLRDATHGHGSNRDNSKGKTNSLLAQHDGRIPHEIAGLGFLYMLDVLANPGHLHRVLSSHAI
ncbi:hypothetical protein [Nocardioides coralli]|uniref:hypothetical protein n=1 Tax=Nocardioides coralli TaxID=2872154 RepID=UPI001CA38AC7|nr:hypothetical protein [Nocardioides coralli]QZY30340.1 hypothetical protein K6T13_06690 [Nocardioides coralli]